MKRYYIILMMLSAICIGNYANGQSIAEIYRKIGDSVVSASPLDSTTLVFDPDYLSPKDMARIYIAMAEIALKKNSVNIMVIEPNQTINRIIKDRYSIENQDNYHISEALKSIISNANNLDTAMTLKVGEKLILPRLPVKARKSKSQSYTQYFDFYNNKLYVSNSISLASSEPSNRKDSVGVKSAAFIAMKLSAEDFASFKEIFTESRYNNTYRKGVVNLELKTVLVNYLKNKSLPPSNKNITIKTDSIASKLLKHLNKKHFGTYFVFDTFNGASIHGEQVMDVIDLKFKEYGLDTTGIAIIRIPSNYFNNVSLGKEILNKHYSLEIDKQANVKHSLEDLEATTALSILNHPNFIPEIIANDEERIPEIYLKALFQYHYRLNPDIISSSFWAESLNGSIMPSVVDYSNTNMITAAENIENDIDDLVQGGQYEDARTRSKQPLHDYYTRYGFDGSMIVGNSIAKGQYAGAFGNKISTLGRGTGWVGSVIKETDLGTSFATPDVATKLYIAKAYWKSKGDTLVGTEARLRLLLASDLDTAYLGLFSSGGTPNMVKLLQLHNYAERVDGQIVRIDSIDFDNANVIINSKETKPFKRSMRIKEGKRKRTEEGMCGLAYCEGNFYGFSESAKEAMWQKIGLKGLNLKFKIGEEYYNITDTSGFIKEFKQIVILKN